MGGATSADARRDAAGDLVGHEDVGQQQAVRAVLLGGAGQDDDRVVVGEERLHLGLVISPRNTVGGFIAATP
jgi:hypothetical protein